MGRGLRALVLAAGLIAPIQDASGKEVFESPKTITPKENKLPKPDKPDLSKEEKEVKVLYSEYQKATQKYREEREKMIRLKRDDEKKFESIVRQADPAGVDEHSSMRALSHDATLKILTEIENCLDVLTPIVESRRGGSFIDKYPVTVRGTMQHAIDLWNEFQAIEDQEAKDAAMAGIVRFLIFQNQMKEEQEKVFEAERTERL